MEWYYANATGEQCGPHTEADMEKLVADKTVHANTLVWSDGMPDWLPARETTLRQKFPASLPPPIPRQQPPPLRRNIAPNIRETPPPTAINSPPNMKPKTRERGWIFAAIATIGAISFIAINIFSTPSPHEAMRRVMNSTTKCYETGLKQEGIGRGYSCLPPYMRKINLEGCPKEFVDAFNGLIAAFEANDPVAAENAHNNLYSVYMKLLGLEI